MWHQFTYTRLGGREVAARFPCQSLQGHGALMELPATKSGELLVGVGAWAAGSPARVQ
jgi:hypothetical protein